MKIFISHSSQDIEFAQKLASDLINLHHDVMLYCDLARAGESISQMGEWGSNLHTSQEMSLDLASGLGIGGDSDYSRCVQSWLGSFSGVIMSAGYSSNGNR